MSGLFINACTQLQENNQNSAVKCRENGNLALVKLMVGWALKLSDGAARIVTIKLNVGEKQEGAGHFVGQQQPIQEGRSPSVQKIGKTNFLVS